MGLVGIIKQTMGKIRVGNKQNSFLNGEWVGHARRVLKKITSGIRRSRDKEIIHNELNNYQNYGKE